uniref:PH domain-containing protein n=1 Tax=Anopheles melas TaxID=34690 RepID=A0A182UKS6_9DIPT
MTGPIKRGLLWQQRDRLFSRWKERYFILTRDYLNCFKRATGSASEKISDMGQFIFKMRLAPSPRNVEETEAESDQSTGRSQFRAKRGNVLSYHCRWLLVGSVSVGLGWRFLRPHGFAAEYVNNATRKVHSKKAVVGRDWVYASTGDIRSRCSRICSIYEQQCAQKVKKKTSSRRSGNAIKCALHLQKSNVCSMECI